MKIAVLGIGGIGGVFGGLLARHYAGSEVVQVGFIARGANLRAIQADGLKVTTPTEEFTACPAFAADQPAEFSPLDVLLFCTKTYHLDAAAEQVKPALAPGAVVISLMNGVDNVERLSAHFPQARILNGSVYISAALEAPGAVRFIGGAGRLLFGSESGDHERFKPLEGLLKDAGIRAEYHEDIRAAVWEKYLFISPIASAGSYTGLPFGGLRSDPAAWALLNGLLSEVESIAAAQGLSFPPGIHAATLDKMLPFPPETKPSMQVDFEKGNPTELETFTGYGVRQGRLLGLPVPLHEQVYQALKTR